MKNSSRRSKEEILLEKIEKEKRKQERLEKRKAKQEEAAQKKLLKNQPKSEADTVSKYAIRVINNQKYHGRTNLEYKAASKNIWMDTDFYFSVVFQTKEQKDLFVKEYFNKLGIKTDYEGGIQIINGMRLAEKIGVKLENAESKDYPLADIDLKDLVLDHEKT